MAALLFFLLAANSVIKIVRDSLFLSRFPITALPYVYLLAALLAGAVIAIYSRYTTRWSPAQVILGSQIFIMSNVVVFWTLIVFYDLGSVLYAFYVWSAIVGLVAVAQFWSLANGLFNPREGKRLFGLLTAAGTLGAMAGGFGANLAVTFLFGTHQLLWLVVVLFGGAWGAAHFAVREVSRRGEAPTRETEAGNAAGAVALLRGSRYLQTIAVLLFVSVIVSTLIDYQFKAAAKSANPSADALASFFGSYYTVLSALTFFAQVWLTRQLVVGVGLSASLLVLPAALFVGSFGMLAWPGLLAATATRLADASLRTSVHRAGVEILYLPVPDVIKKRVKVFLDVTVERLGDGAAASLILVATVLLGGSGTAPLGAFSLALIGVWIAAVLVLRGGYMDALRGSLSYRELSLEGAPIDYADEATVEAILKELEEKDARSVLFALDLVEKLDPAAVVMRLPRPLLRHPSPEVRRRALTLFARFADADMAAEVLALLASEGPQVQAETIKAACAGPGQEAMVLARPFLASADPEVRSAAIQSLLQCGHPDMRRSALDALADLLADRGPQGERSRVEAARLMGATAEPEFPARLGRLIAEDPSPTVVREAMIAAARGKYRAAVPQIISRLCDRATKSTAREALVRYGELAVKPMRAHLSDDRVARDIRLHIPRTLSKIDAQAAMDALLGGLLEEDRAVRFQAILAVDEMARRFPRRRVDRQIVESAIMSDALLYYQRLVIFSALFGDREDASSRGASILYYALRDSMDRVKERVMWLLSLIHPARDIRRSWSGLNSKDPLQRAHALELLDNLLGGNVRKYVFSLYSDDRPEQRLRRALELLGIAAMDADAALGALLEQDDRWLKAATIWEIGARKLARFRDAILRHAGSGDALLQETSSAVLRRI